MTDHNETSSSGLDTLLQNDTGRRLFAQFLKEFNNASDSLLTMYLICSCFQSQRVDDRNRIKQILEKTYKECFVKNQMPYLNPDLKQKLCESLKKCTYNESVFTAVRKEIRNLLQNEYLPLFLASKLYQENLSNTNIAPMILNSNQELSKHSKLQFDDILTESSQFAIPNKPQKSSKNSKTSSTNIIPPVTPSTSSKQTSSKLNKTSSQLSTSSRSINTLNESTLSLNMKSSRAHKYENNYPPNPYSVITKAIPVSCQDSELQSVVSADDLNLKQRTHYSKLDKHIKQNLLANKNARLNMPEFQPNFNPDEPSVPLKTNQPQGSKKVPIPLAESDPKAFFEMLCARLEQVLVEQNGLFDCSDKPSKQRSLSNSHLPLHATIQQQIEANNAKNALQLCDSAIDSQLDEHLDRVYNNMQKNIASPKMNAANLSSRFNNLSINKPKAQMPKHHFYQLTSTSKEVDIDSQNHDSGVSTKTVSSIERVNDWLISSQNKEEDHTSKYQEKKSNKLAEEESVKTTVAYYLPGEELAYISTFNGKYLTLAQFKQLITKKGQFRYFFKTKSDLLDEECVVFRRPPMRAHMCQCLTIKL